MNPIVEYEVRPKHRGTYTAVVILEDKTERYLGTDLCFEDAEALCFRAIRVENPNTK